MAKSTEERLEEAIGAAGALAVEVTGGRVQSLTVDFQASNELPFRMVVPNETLPLVGLARLPAQPDPTGTPNGSVAASRTGSA